MLPTPDPPPPRCSWTHLPESHAAQHELPMFTIVQRGRDHGAVSSDGCTCAPMISSHSVKATSPNRTGVAIVET